MPKAAAVLALVSALAALAAGCGRSEDRADARAVTERFYEAVGREQGQVACDLLTDETARQLESQAGEPCAEAVTELAYEGGEVGDAVVYVTNAKVDLSSGESAFLSLEPEGWRLSAVACTPEAGRPRDRPFDCELEA